MKLLKKIVFSFSQLPLPLRIGMLILLCLLVLSIPLFKLVSRPQRPEVPATHGVYSANIDFAAGGYGAYHQADLTNPNIGGIDINVNWANVEPQQGQINFAPLDQEMSDWGSRGKKVVLILRFANEVGGGCPGGHLPAWEIARIPTFCDTDLNSTIPDYFNSTFQADWQAFVKAIADHVAQSPYRSAVAYVRAAAGLEGEGFFLTYRQDDFPQDEAQLAAWGYTPAAWKNWQEQMMRFYKNAFSYAPVIYPIVQLDTDPATGIPVQEEVAEWAADHGMGIGQQGLAPNYPTDYANIQEITSYVQSHDPAAYIQFQTLSGVGDAATVQGDIQTAEQLGACSIEWWENITNDPDYQTLFAQWQQYVDTHCQAQRSTNLPGVPSTPPLPQIASVLPTSTVKGGATNGLNVL